jgi:hypothetical protein
MAVLKGLTGQRFGRLTAQASNRRRAQTEERMAA